MWFDGRDGAPEKTAVVSPSPTASKSEVEILRGDLGRTTKRLEDLKDQINASFEEVSNLFLQLQQQINDIEDRLQKYNARSSHKI